MNNENKGIHPTGVSSRVWIALVALCVANVVAHLMVMPSLPAQIPTHWGANGAVDGKGGNPDAFRQLGCLRVKMIIRMRERIPAPGALNQMQVFSKHRAALVDGQSEG